MIDSVLATREKFACKRMEREREGNEQDGTELTWSWSNQDTDTPPRSLSASLGLRKLARHVSGQESHTTHTNRYKRETKKKKGKKNITKEHTKKRSWFSRWQNSIDPGNSTKQSVTRRIEEKAWLYHSSNQKKKKRSCVCDFLYLIASSCQMKRNSVIDDNPDQAICA